MISIIGSILGITGYDNHTRGVINSLADLTEISLTTNLIPGWESVVTDKELKALKTQSDFKINLIITHPRFWRVNCFAKRNWVYLIWEGDSVPEWIVNECLNPSIEKIIVPSTHTFDALIDSTDVDTNYQEIKNKVVIIPHGVDLEIFKHYSRQKSEETGEEAETGQPGPRQLPADTFKFLANKGFRNLEDRGGIQYLIKAYLEEFTNEDNVELILKINPAYGIANFQELFPELSKPNAPKILLNADALSKEELNKLYNDCDVFVSPTRAEAFNLPCLEAMACGKPVITTNFGGQIDYCSDETGWLIDYELVPVEHELEYEGIKWANPNIKKLREALRQAFEDPGTCTLGNTALETAKQFTWDNTAKLIKELE